MKTGCCTGLTFWLDAQEEVPSISSGMLHLSQPTMTIIYAHSMDISHKYC